MNIFERKISHSWLNSSWSCYYAKVLLWVLKRKNLKESSLKICMPCSIQFWGTLEQKSLCLYFQCSRTKAKITRFVCEEPGAQMVLVSCEEKLIPEQKSHKHETQEVRKQVFLVKPAICTPCDLIRTSVGILQFQETMVTRSE